MEVKDKALAKQIRESLHLGEIEAIALAGEIKADLIILDDKKAREFAEKEGLKVAGLLALLIIAKEKRIIERVKTFVDVPKDSYKDYLDSALNALEAAKVLLNNKSYEWVIVPAYSAIFQAGNAILIKELGKECKDHFCLLVSLLKINIPSVNPASA